MYIPDVTMDVVLNGEPSIRARDVKGEKDDEVLYQSVSVAKPPPPAYFDNPNDGCIKFGSRICIRHDSTKGLLRTSNSRYVPSLGTTSQNVIYIVRFQEPVQGDWWQVATVKEAMLKMESMSKDQTLSMAAACASSIHKSGSPVRRDQQEICSFGDVDLSDANDVWIVEKAEGNSGFWKTNEAFLLRHETTGQYLHSEGISYLGEMGVTAFGQRNDRNNYWCARFA
ncbi:hypothetical protein BGX26_000368 [Mortierella sp. AD094]|nr:hypothetical protein BGX26_000368 [Mortierella sp. AD094]